MGLSVGGNELRCAKGWHIVILHLCVSHLTGSVLNQAVVNPVSLLASGPWPGNMCELTCSSGGSCCAQLSSIPDPKVAALGARAT